MHRDLGCECMGNLRGTETRREESERKVDERVNVKERKGKTRNNYKAWHRNFNAAVLYKITQFYALIIAFQVSNGYIINSGGARNYFLGELSPSPPFPFPFPSPSFPSLRSRTFPSFPFPPFPSLGIGTFVPLPYTLP